MSLEEAERNVERPREEGDVRSEVEMDVGVMQLQAKVTGGDRGPLAAGGEDQATFSLRGSRGNQLC